MPAATRAPAPTIEQKKELPPEAYRQAVDQADLAISITDAKANILFANEAEITTLFGTDDFDAAAAEVRGKVKIACLTRSEKGSVILHGDETYEIAAVPVPQVVDTTGAGDLYAAGFLYGYTQGMDLARICYGSHLGPRGKGRLCICIRDSR